MQTVKWHNKKLGAFVLQENLRALIRRNKNN